MDNIKTMVAENVRVLKEIEEQLKAKIVSGFSIAYNSLGVDCVIMQGDHVTMSNVLYAKFMLNNTPITIQTKISNEDTDNVARSMSHGKVRDILAPLIAEEIAKHLLDAKPIDLRKT